MNACGERVITVGDGQEDPNSNAGRNYVFHSRLMIVHSVKQFYIKEISLV